MSGTSEGARKAAETKRRLGLVGGMGLRELRAKTPPGECPFCGDPLGESVTKPHQTCGDEICRAAYHRFYGRDRRRTSDEAKRAQ